MINHNLWESLHKRLAADLDPKKNRGAMVEFCKKTGFHRTKVVRWISRESVPALDELEAISMWFGMQPWELLKPEDASATPRPNEKAKYEILSQIIALCWQLNESEMGGLLETAQDYVIARTRPDDLVDRLPKNKKLRR